MSETNKMNNLILNGQHIDLSPDYQNIRNKPKINGVDVEGNKTLADFGIATKESVETVSEKVAKLPYGIYYGQYNDVESLPDTSQLTQKGYAYVASSDPAVYYIYIFDGEGSAWEDSGNKFVTTELETDLETKSQTKAPTTEAVKEGIEAVDITKVRTQSTELSAVAKYNASANINDRAADVVPVTNEVKALGYKVLNHNLSFASQVVTENTVYEIKDNFNLGGTEEDNEVSCDTLVYNTATINEESGVVTAHTDIYINETPIVLTGNQGVIVESDSLLLCTRKETTVNGITTVTYPTAVAGKVRYYLQGTYYIGKVSSGNANYKVDTPIDLPSNSTLKFNGGMLANGTIAGNKSIIEASYKIFDDVQVVGDWKCVGKVCWWANGNGFVESVVNGIGYYRPTKIDETIELQTALDSSFKELVFEPVCYYITDTLELHNDKNLELVGTSSHYLFNSTNYDAQNKTFIFTDLNINMLTVNLIPMSAKRHFSINGGIFDASMIGAGYNSTIIKVNTGTGQRIWGCEINTTIFGSYASAPNKPTGTGILIGDYGTRTDGYATMIRVNSNIEWLGIGIKTIGESTADSQSGTTGWVSDVVIDGIIDSCRTAIDVSTDADIKASIQPRAFFTQDEKDNEACIIVRGVSAVGISSMIWDLNTGADYYTNGKALKITDDGNRRINVYGQFLQSILQKRGYNTVLGSVSRIYPNFLTTNGQWFPYDKTFSVGNSLHDIMLGYDLMNLGNYSVKLFRVTETEQGGTTVQTTTEDTTTISISGLNNIFRDNSNYATLSTSTPLGEKDYFELAIDLPEDQPSAHIILSSLGLMFYGSNKTVTPNIGNIKFVKLFLTNSETTYQVPISQPRNTDYSRSGTLNADYVFYEVTYNMYSNISFAFRIYGEGESTFRLYRVFANQLQGDYQSSDLVNPYISRVGGNVYGDTTFSGNHLISNGTRIKGASKDTFNLISALNANRVLKINIDVSFNTYARQFLFIFGNYSYIDSSTGFAPIPTIFSYTIAGSAMGKSGAIYNAGNLRHILASLQGVFYNSFKLYRSKSSSSLSIILVPPTFYSGRSSISLLGNYDDAEIVEMTATQISSDYVEITDNILKVPTAATSVTPPITQMLWTGCSYFNTTLKKPVWWNGSSWVDSNGESVGLQVKDTTILLEAAESSSKIINVYSSSAITATAQNPDGSTTDLWLTANVGTLTDGAYPVTLTANSANSTNPRGAKVIISNGTDVIIVNVVQNYATT